MQLCRVIRKILTPKFYYGPRNVYFSQIRTDTGVDNEKLPADIASGSFTQITHNSENFGKIEGGPYVQNFSGATHRTILDEKVGKFFSKQKDVISMKLL